jgi:hypothetical protein
VVAQHGGAITQEAPLLVAKMRELSELPGGVVGAALDRGQQRQQAAAAAILVQINADSAWATCKSVGGSGRGRHAFPDRLLFAFPTCDL